jgi:hypothetical protein
VVRRAAFPLFRPAAADRGQQRNLETHNACRSTDRLQTFRAGAALARHSHLFNNTGARQIDYFYPSQLASETAPVYDVHFKPVEPLSVRFTLSMTF